jgi:hypothetical protein
MTDRTVSDNSVSVAASDKTAIKHSNPTPLTLLTNSKLPPRKRVRQVDYSIDDTLTSKNNTNNAGNGSSVSSTSSSQQSGSSLRRESSVDDLCAALRCCMLCQKKEGEERVEGVVYTLAQCPNQHTACGECLMVQAKKVLSGKQKESLTCMIETCNSFYPISE